MGKAIRHIFNTGTLQLTECTDGFWLYDYKRCQNIAMRSKTEREAVIEGLTWYQARLEASETTYKILNDKVQSFIGQIGYEEN